MRKKGNHNSLAPAVKRKGKQLPVSFFLDQDVLRLSRELIGKVLVSHIGGKHCSGIIVEAEAYRAPDDKACHAYGNKRTPRTETMFARGGHAYVYLCYGIHHMVNVVTAEEGVAHAVLIRALEPFEGIRHMMARRGLTEPKPRLTSGPGALGQALGVRVRDHNGLDLSDPNSPLQLHDHGIKVAEKDILKGPRVGMSAHTGECGQWPWRFRLAGSRWTSAFR